MGEKDCRNSATPVEVLVLEAASGGVLALTSQCNLNCFFCSNRQNPPGVEVLRIAPRTLAQVAEALSFVDPAGPVTIGESATRVVEGEPFTHPQILEVLELVRRTLPRAAIRITTNGSLLDRRAAEVLARLGNVEVCLSLNSASLLGRGLLTGDENPAAALKAPHLLREYGVPFHGSIVALPHVVGWADLEETVLRLAEDGARTVRLFLPGFTRLAPPALVFGPGLWEELAVFAKHFGAGTGVPVLCEPPLVGDLKPQVAGVMAGTPAAAVGLSAGDVLLTVNGVAALSRVHAFEMVHHAASPLLDVQRGKEVFQVRLPKRAGERPGLVVEWDLDPALVDALAGEVRRRRARRVLVLASQLGRPLLEAGILAFGGSDLKIEVMAVENRFFGGSIACAGLLTVADFQEALEERWSGKRPPFDLILLPGAAFDARGRDLTGRSYRELEEKCGVPAVPVGRQ